VCLRSNDVTLGPGWVVLKAVHGISSVMTYSALALMEAGPDPPVKSFEAFLDKSQ